MNATHRKYSEATSLTLFEGMTLKILLSGSETGGLHAVFEDIVVPGAGPGRHIHHQQDEIFVFIEGSFEVEIDGQRYNMTAGDTAFVPKGTIHAWKNVGEGIGRLCYIFSPALNIEQMFRELDAMWNSKAMSEASIHALMANYPEQEAAGPPL
jgi:quercetin dioxygenase-like cupin family protein